MAALLVQITGQDDLDHALSGRAADWQGRVEMRLLGPMAAYDFASTPLARAPQPMSQGAVDDRDPH